MNQSNTMFCTTTPSGKISKGCIVSREGEGTWVEVGHFPTGDSFTPQISIMNYRNIKNLLEGCEVDHDNLEECGICRYPRIIKNEGIVVSTILSQFLPLDDKKLEVSVQPGRHLFKAEELKGWTVSLNIEFRTVKNVKVKKYILVLKTYLKVTQEDIINAVEKVMLLGQGFPLGGVPSLGRYTNYSDTCSVKNKWNSIIPSALGLYDPTQFNEYISRSKDITIKDVGNVPLGKYKVVNHSMVTAKLDGVRKYLFFTGTQREACVPYDVRVYEIYAPLDIRCISVLPHLFSKKKLSSDKSLEGTILDTEFVDGRYYPFDILSVRGKNVMKYKFVQRLQMLKEEMANVGEHLPTEHLPGGLHIQMLDMEGGNTYLGLEHTKSGTFGELAEKCLAIIKEKNIPNDGLIIQPLPAQYINQPPASFKWKPADQLNMDFRVSGGGDVFSLYYFDRNELKKFEGNGMHKYTQNIIFKDGMFEGSSVEGSIVEFCFRGDNFVPLRVRHDKTRPNGKITIFNLWNLIQNPVSEEILTSRKT